MTQDHAGTGTSRGEGFTLLELLIVVSIMAMMGTMLMPLLSLARRSGQRANTEVVLRTVHTAMRMFQRDVGVLPYLDSSVGDLSPTNPFRNGLARRLGHTLTAGERADLNAAVSMAAGKYAYNCDLNPYNWRELEPQPSGLVCTQAWAARIANWDGGNFARPGILDQYTSSDRANPVELAYVVNRLGMQRARLAVLAGALDLTGPLLTRPGGNAPVADLSGTRLLQPAECPSGVVGWCDDYLEGALDPGRFLGDDILDAYGNPVVLISAVIPKVQASNVQIGFGAIGGFDASWFGLGTSGFRPGTGPWASLIAARRWRLLSLGRVRLSVTDAGDGQPTPGDANCLPDPTALFVSDRRYYAAPGFEVDAELWSAGPTGSFAWMRNAAANTHAIPFSPVYDRGLR